MCTFVIVTKGADGTEFFHPCVNEEFVKTKTADFKADDKIASIKVFKLAYTINRVTEWRQTAAPVRPLPPPEEPRPIEDDVVHPPRVRGE